MRVLIVDDDALVAQSLSTILSVEADVDVVGLGGSGPEAIERYRELAPDILLMDIRMPEMDGYEACRQIRGAGRRDSLTIPIVAMTANAFSEDIELAGKSGMNAHLAKPVDAEQMISLLKEVLAGEKNG